MKQKPNKPKQEPRERPGSWESAADPGGAAGGGSPGGAGAGDSGTSGQSVHKSKFRQKSKQEQAKLERAKDKLAKQKPPKKPGPVRRIGRAAGGAAHGFVHGKIYENEQENVGIEGAHRSELVGESGLRHGKRFVQKKIRQHPAKAVQRAESKYVKATADYHFRMAAQEHPEMSGNPVSQMWRKHRLKKQYQKRAREAAKTGAASAAKKTAAATEKAGAKIAGFVKRHPVGVLLALACGPGLCAPALYDAVLFVLPGDAWQRRGGRGGRDYLPIPGRGNAGGGGGLCGNGGGAPGLPMTSTTSTWTALSTIPMC